jgi:hypothetical protein
MSGTRRRPGRLGPFVEGYRVWLLEAGYTPQTVRAMLKELGSLGRWMDAGDFGAVGTGEGLRASRATGQLRRNPPLNVERRSSLRFGN